MSKDLSEVIGRVIPAPENFLSPEKLEQARKARRSFMGKALAMGAGVAQALGQCKAVLMRNHGVAVVGANIEESTILTIMLENACQIQLAAQSGGGIGEQFDAPSIERLHFNITRAEQYTVNFEYLKRKAYRALGRPLPSHA